MPLLDLSHECLSCCNVPLVLCGIDSHISCSCQLVQEELLTEALGAVLLSYLPCLIRSSECIELLATHSLLCTQYVLFHIILQTIHAPAA